jgi:phenylacetate-CoA ligase
MFVRPEQVASLVASHETIERARVIATREEDMDAMSVQIETTASDPSLFDDLVKIHLKLKGTINLVAPGCLPRDGLVIEDQRKYD